MMNNQPSNNNNLPWTREQFQQMKMMLEVTIPSQEDNLNRAEKAGIDVSNLKVELAKHKKSLADMIAAFGDKYK